MKWSLRSFFSPEGDDSSILCSGRSSVAEEEVQTSLKALTSLATSDKVALIEIGEDERTYSSTEVRKMRKNGDQGWKKLVTQEVVEYIEQEKLYIV